MKRKIVSLCAALTLFGASTESWAQAVTLEASTEVWLREAGPDSTFENDLVSVWSSSGNDGARRYGVIEFDLSSVAGEPIHNATLRLWAGAFGFSDDLKPIKQSAVAIDTSGGTQTSGMTWTAYQGEYAAAAQVLNDLGRIDFAPAGTEALGQFIESSANASDLALIEGAANSANGLLTLILIADESGEDYAKSWGDGPDGLGGMNAELVVNRSTVEVPALGAWGQAFVAGSLLVVGVLVLFRRRTALAA